MCLRKYLCIRGFGRWYGFKRIVHINTELKNKFTMKKQLFNLKIAVLALGIGFSTAAKADFTVTSSGNWSDATTWGGTAPGAIVTSSNVLIPSGFTVTLDM